MSNRRSLVLLLVGLWLGVSGGVALSLVDAGWIIVSFVLALAFFICFAILWHYAEVRVEFDQANRRARVLFNVLLWVQFLGMLLGLDRKPVVPMFILGSFSGIVHLIAYLVGSIIIAPTLYFAWTRPSVSQQNQLDSPNPVH